MKNKKRSFLMILFLTAILLLFVACKQQENSCEPPLADYVNNAIDWENYNDAGIVYANNNLYCSDVRVKQNNGESIKIYGWLIIKNNKINITHDSLYALGQKESESCCVIPIHCTSEIQTAIASYDLTRKCYLKGLLKLENVMGSKGNCCQMAPRIILKDINDICFK